jgi:hypothetical protein
VARGRKLQREEGKGRGKPIKRSGGSASFIGKGKGADGLQRGGREDDGDERFIRWLSTFS